MLASVVQQGFQTQPNNTSGAWRGLWSPLDDGNHHPQPAIHVLPSSSSSCRPHPRPGVLVLPSSSRHPRPHPAIWCPAADCQERHPLRPVDGRELVPTPLSGRSAIIFWPSSKWGQYGGGVVVAALTSSEDSSPIHELGQEPEGSSVINFVQGDTREGHFLELQIKKLRED